jgi:hypothetical protein
MLFETHTLNDLMHQLLSLHEHFWIGSKFTWKDAKDKKVLENMQPMVSILHA